MPGAANNDFDAERFAALWAGADAMNSNEAEAVMKFRALRRMAVEDNLRIVDLMGRADVMAALDAQLQPVREENEEVKKLYLQNTELAELAHGQEQLIEQLQRQLAGGVFAASRTSAGGLVNGGLVAVVVVVAVALMIAAVVQSFQ